MAFRRRWASVDVGASQEPNAGEAGALLPRRPGGPPVLPWVQGIRLRRPLRQGRPHPGHPFPGGGLRTGLPGNAEAPGLACALPPWRGWRRLPLRHRLRQAGGHEHQGGKGRADRQRFGMLPGQEIRGGNLRDPPGRTLRRNAGNAGGILRFSRNAWRATKKEEANRRRIAG